MMFANSPIIHRHLHEPLTLAARGDGVYIIDSEGNRYLDASGGAAVSCLGHSHSRVIQAIQDQVSQIAYVHSNFFTSESTENLANFLVEKAPPRLDRIYFVSGGSEAIESALKLARQYYIEQGQTQRRIFVARRQSFHGNTLGALAVGGDFCRRKHYEPLLLQTEHVDPCYAYRNQKVGESNEEYGHRAAMELEKRLLEIGPDNVIAFVAEPVVGAAAGVLLPAPGYFKTVREICDRFGILLIFDEVMCGMGRTGTLFACEQEAVAPDIVTLAKGLGAGYQPIGAMMCTNNIINALSDGSGYFQHGHTYMGHATACAAALAVQQTIVEENLLENICNMGDKLCSALHERFDHHPYVGDIRGRGLLWGLELVANRKDKEPLDAKLMLHKSIKHEAMRCGLICYPGSGTIDGKRGNHILLAPPFIVNEDHINELVEKLGRALDVALTLADLPL